MPQSHNIFFLSYQILQQYVPSLQKKQVLIREEEGEVHARSWS
jgi:hypothetical protein